MKGLTIVLIVLAAAALFVPLAAAAPDAGEVKPPPDCALTNSCYRCEVTNSCPKPTATPDGNLSTTGDYYPKPTRPPCGTACYKPPVPTIPPPRLTQ